MGLSIKTNRLRKIIQQQLLTKCPAVFYRKAKNAAGDHVVFVIDSFTANETVNVLSLEVRVIGTGDDTAAIEDLADDIWEMFDHFYYVADDIELAVYQNMRSIVEEDDSVIYRRLVFEVRAL